MIFRFELFLETFFHIKNLVFGKIKNVTRVCGRGEAGLGGGRAVSMSIYKGGTGGGSKISPKAQIRKPYPVRMLTPLSDHCLVELKGKEVAAVVFSVATTRRTGIAVKNRG